MQTVACFGDSLIYGFPFGPRTSWLAEAEKVTGDKFLNYGVCGDCTDDILFRLQTMFYRLILNIFCFWEELMISFKCIRRNLFWKIWIKP